MHLFDRPYTRRLFLNTTAVSAVSAATGTLSLTGCASAPTPVAIRPSLPHLGIYSAGQGSGFLPYAQALGKELTAAGLQTTALESAGSIDNLRKLQTEPQRLATAFMGTVYEGTTGTASWTQGQKMTHLRALFPMYETSFQVAALLSSGISSLAALQDKRVGVGPAGGPGESFFKGLVEAQIGRASCRERV